MNSATPFGLIAALALVLTAVVGCGDGNDANDGGLYVRSPDPSQCLSFTIDGTPYVICPTATPTPAYPPAKATISCFTIDQTPAGPCPTWTPS